MFKLAPYRKHIKGMPDLLNYGALVDDGVMVNKDGSLMAGFVFRGVDISSSTVDERNRLTSRISDLLCSFGTGWMVHVEAARKASPEYLNGEPSTFTHPVFAMIDEERKQYFSEVAERYESDYFMFVTYMPPSKGKAKIKQWMFETAHQPQSLFSGHLAHFKKKLRDVESRLKSYISIRPLRAYSAIEDDGKGDTHKVYYCELLQKLNYFISGKDHPIRLPFCPMGVDAIIGGHELWTGITPNINGKHIAVVSIDDFPDNSSPNILNHLDKLGLSYRWSTRYSFFDLFDAEKALEGERKKWKQRIVSFKDQLMKNPSPQINEDAAQMVYQYEQALNAARSGRLKYGHYTSSVILMDDNSHQLSHGVEQVVKRIEHLGFKCRVETVNTVEAFLGSLPGDSIHNIRRPLVSTVNLADMLPMSSIWSGSKTNPCPYYPKNSPALMQCSAEGEAPFRLNLHVGDLGHSLIFGPTGSGKSTLLAMLAAQANRYASNMVIFDKKRSAYAISQCGGTHYDIGVDAEVTFAPLSQLREDFAWCVNYVIQLLELQGLAVTAKQRNDIEEGLNQLKQSSIEHITLGEFVNIANDSDIIEALTYYTSGIGGDLLNSPTDSFTAGGLQVFEIEELERMGDKAMLPVLLYIFRRIERSLDGSPSFIFIDEAWIALGHPVFREKIREWLKVLRDANCVVALFTQNLSEAVNSGMLDVLVESCPTKIFLPNKNAPQFSEMYQKFGLNHRQINIIKDAEPKREYYITSPDGNRLFNLNLGELALSFVGASGKKNVAAIKQHVKTHGKNWYQHWLVTRGVIDEQTRLSIEG